MSVENVGATIEVPTLGGAGNLKIPPGTAAGRKLRLAKRGLPRPGGGELNLVGPAIRLSRTPARMKRAMGPAGEHDEEILRDLGYVQAEIAQLRAGQGV